VPNFAFRRLGPVLDLGEKLPLCAKKTGRSASAVKKVGNARKRLKKRLAR
jgi:hypothetical protein